MSLKLLKEKGIWTTKDARKIKISDLTNDHLINILKKLKRYGESVRLEYAKLLCSVDFQGDMAQLEVDSALDELIESDWTDNVPGAERLLAEAKKRGLKCLL